MKHDQKDLYSRTNHQQVERGRSIDQPGTDGPGGLQGAGVTDQTYYRWRRAYGGLKVDQGQRLKELEQENSRLKRLVADLSLDNAIIKEALKGK